MQDKHLANRDRHAQLAAAAGFSTVSKDRKIAVTNRQVGTDLPFGQMISDSPRKVKSVSWRLCEDDTGGDQHPVTLIPGRSLLKYFVAPPHSPELMNHYRTILLRPRFLQVSRSTSAR